MGKRLMGVRIFLLCGLVAVTASCAPTPVFSAAPSEAGRLSLAGDQLQFRPSGASADEVIRDSADRIGAELLSQFGGETLVVMIRPAQVGYRMIAEVRYAGLEGPGCDRIPPEGRLEARGTEPFWTLEVGDEIATFRTPEQPDGVVYDRGSWRVADGHWQFSRGSAGGGNRLVLELTETSCADAMSGAHYPFRAVLVIDDRRLEGCALEGRRAFDFAPQM